MNYYILRCLVFFSMTVIGFSGCKEDEKEPVTGCTDANALNYNPLAEEDDSTCHYLTVKGCTDAHALNYNPLANEDDSTCQYLINLFAGEFQMTCRRYGWDPGGSHDTTYSSQLFICRAGSSLDTVIYNGASFPIRSDSSFFDSRSSISYTEVRLIGDSIFTHYHYDYIPVVENVTCRGIKVSDDCIP